MALALSGSGEKYMHEHFGLDQPKAASFAEAVAEPTEKPPKDVNTGGRSVTCIDPRMPLASFPFCCLL